MVLEQDNLRREVARLGAEVGGIVHGESVVGAVWWV